MKKTILALTLAAALSACGTLDTAEKQILAACASIAHSTEAITPHVDKLDETTLNAVNRTLATAEPICTAEGDLTYDKVKATALNRAASDLLRLAETLK